jgi:hypothetical protein
MSILGILKTVNFGQRVAEEEGDQLSSYFVETDHWHRLYSDAVDVIYGQKGAGKSALYSLLVARRNDLFDRGVLLAPGENPRGAPAFRALVTDPPVSEREFIALWKLYMACLVSDALDDYGIPGHAAEELHTILEKSGLRQKHTNLQSVLLSAFDYVKRLLRPSAIETGVMLDPALQMPAGVTAKILFAEPSIEETKQGFTSVDRLLELADEALAASNYKLWFLLDRLDVAFSESHQLEQNALRALFHAYLDLLSLKNLRLKIFLRTDIWRRITSTGFREASHITRHLTIEWNRNSLLNLVIRRVLQNEEIVSQYGIQKEQVLFFVLEQEKLFYRLFPDQVEAGARKSNTFDWMVGRTCDATRQCAPRELIHLLNSLREVQTRRLEIGDPEPEGGRLFARGAFKEALPEVSNVRLTQTLYSEYPDARDYIEKLRGEKTQHTLNSLANLWKNELTPEGSFHMARYLAEIGFFEIRGDKGNPIYWVPLLYRDALNLVQGASD